MRKIIDKMGIKDWPATIGWLIFIGLTISMLADNTIFDPLLFGFAYYVIYTLVKHAKKQEGTTFDDLFLVSVIALLYLYSDLHSQAGTSSFVRQVNKTCHPRSITNMGYDTETANRICEDIMSNIDDHLYRKQDDYY